MNELRQQYGYPSVNIDSLRRSFTALGMYDANNWIGKNVNASIPAKETITTDYTLNTTISDKVISVFPTDINNSKKLLEAHGFNANEFMLVNARNSKWEQGSKDGTKVLYSSRITVKPKMVEDITFEDVDNFFENHRYNTNLRINPTQYDPDGEFLEVCLDDLHLGLFSYGCETGEDYDINIAEKRLKLAIGDIIERCKGRKFKRIILALMGDILHVDNAQGTTTKGTHQDVDTRPTKMFDEALNELISIINTLGSIAPVYVVNVTGNHAVLTEYYLCKALEMAYRDDDNVVFYNSPNPRKALRFGKVLIGYTHGDMKTNAISTWLQNEYASDWGKTLFREVHCGHLHSLSSIDRKFEESENGVIVRRLTALTASSSWEHREGYAKNIRTMMSFVWNEDKGLREVWYSNI